MLDFQIFQEGEKFSVKYCWRKGHLFGFSHVTGFSTQEEAGDWITIREEFEKREQIMRE